jgi:hypothetical protein
MCVLKLTLRKIFFYKFFFDFQKRPDGLGSVWTHATLPIANLAVGRPDELVTRPDAIHTGFYLSLAFPTFHTALHFIFVMLCVSLADFSLDFGILYTSLLIP